MMSAVAQTWLGGGAGRVALVLGAIVGLPLAGCGSEAPSVRSSAVVVARTATTTATPASVPAPRVVSRAGRRAVKACRGRRAGEVRRRYLRVTRPVAVDRRLAKLAADPPKNLRGGDASVALAAAVYASTRPAAGRAEAYAACRFELSRVLTKKGSSR
jgi:hypothetical protein